MEFKTDKTKSYNHLLMLDTLRLNLPHSHFTKLEEFIYRSGNELHMLTAVIKHCIVIMVQKVIVLLLVYKARGRINN